MREVLKVNREGMIPLLSSFGMVSVSSSFIYGHGPCITLFLSIKRLLSIIALGFVLASSCVSVSSEYFWIVIWSDVILRIFAHYIILCDVFI